jgi:hypothetical protein
LNAFVGLLYLIRRLANSISVYFAVLSSLQVNVNLDLVKKESTE